MIVNKVLCVMYISKLTLHREGKIKRTEISNLGENIGHYIHN